MTTLKDGVWCSWIILGLAAALLIAPLPAPAVPMQDLDSSWEEPVDPGTIDPVPAPYRGGALLWERQVDIAGGYDSALAATAGGGRVFATGYGLSAGGGADLLIQAFDVASGSLLWRDQVDKGGYADIGHAVALDGSGLVFVGGGGTSRPARDYDFLVRAYSASTGRLLWEDQVDKGGRDEVYALATDWWRVFAVGLGTSTSGNADLLVRAYEKASGALLWERQVDLTGHFDAGFAVATFPLEDVVFVAGGGGNASNQPVFLVRAYDASSGSLWWADQRDFGYALAMAADHATFETRGKVFVAGYGVFVRAYNAYTGAVLWEDSGRNVGGWASAITVANGRVFVAGYFFQAMPGNGSSNISGSLVRAYDAVTGALLWENRFDVDLASANYSHATAVTAANGRVFVAGLTNTNPWPDADLRVRAYSAASGALLWEDRYDRGGGLDIATALAYDGGRVIAAGITTDPWGNSDFTLRAYDGF